MSNRLLLKIFTILLSALPLSSIAQDAEEMAERLQKVQVCMQELDRTELKRIEAEFQTLQTDIKQLCDSGKQEQAQQKAFAFAEELESSLVIKQTKKCAEIMGDMMPDFPLLDMPDDYGELNVCGQ